MSSGQPVEAWRDPAIIKAKARPYYTDDLPFHPFGHAVDVRQNVRTIVQACLEAGEPLSQEEAEDVDVAAIWHDAGFHIPTQQHGFKSKEVFSAYIAANEQRALGMPSERIHNVFNYILSTELGVPPQSRGAKVVRRADLWNVAYDTHKFVVGKTVALFNEDRLLKAKYGHPGEVKTDLLGFAAGSQQVLARYNQDDVLIGDFDIDPNGKSNFTNLVDRNLQYLLSPKIEGVLAELGMASLVEV